MIGPPTPFDVFSRYSHLRPTSTIAFLNHLLPQYRHTDSVLSVGCCDIEFLRALREYHPNAIVHSLSDSRIRTEHRIQSYVHLQFSSLQQFAVEFSRSFDVVLLLDDTDPTPLQLTLRDWGLLFIESPIYHYIRNPYVQS